MSDIDRRTLGKKLLPVIDIMLDVLGRNLLTAEEFNKIQELNEYLKDEDTNTSANP